MLITFFFTSSWSEREQLLPPPGAPLAKFFFVCEIFLHPLCRNFPPERSPPVALLSVCPLLWNGFLFSLVWSAFGPCAIGEKTEFFFCFDLYFFLIFLFFYFPSMYILISSLLGEVYYACVLLSSSRCRCSSSSHFSGR